MASFCDKENEASGFRKCGGGGIFEKLSRTLFRGDDHQLQFVCCSISTLYTQHY